MKQWLHSFLKKCEVEYFKSYEIFPFFFWYNSGIPVVSCFLNNKRQYAIMILGNVEVSISGRFCFIIWNPLEFLKHRRLATARIPWISHGDTEFLGNCVFQPILRESAQLIFVGMNDVLHIVCKLYLLLLDMVHGIVQYQFSFNSSLRYLLPCQPSQIWK